MRKSVIRGALVASVLVLVLSLVASAAFIGHDLYPATPVSDWLTFNVSGTNSLTQVGAQQGDDHALSFAVSRDGYVYYPDGFVAADKVFDVMLVRYKGTMTDGSVPADIEFTFTNKTDADSNDITVTASFDALEEHASVSNVAIDDSDSVTTSFSGFSANTAFAQYGLVAGNGKLTFDTAVISPDETVHVTTAKTLLYSHLADTTNPYVLVRAWLVGLDVNPATLDFATLGTPVFSRLFNGGDTRTYDQEIGEIRRNNDKKLLLVIDNMWKGDVVVDPVNAGDIINTKRFLAPVFTYPILEAGDAPVRIPAGTSLAVFRATPLVSGGTSLYALSFGRDEDSDDEPDTVSTVNVRWTPITGGIEIVDSVTTPAGIGLDATVSKLVAENPIFTADEKAKTLYLVTDEEAIGDVAYARIIADGVVTGGNMTVDGTDALDNSKLGASYVEFDMDIASADLLKGVISASKYTTLKTALDTAETSDAIFAALANANLNFYAVYPHDYDNIGTLIAPDGTLAKKAFALGWNETTETLSIRYRVLLLDSEKAGAILRTDPSDAAYFIVSDGSRNGKPNAKIVLANASVIDSLVTKATEDEERPVDTSFTELGLPASFDVLAHQFPQFGVAGASSAVMLTKPGDVTSGSFFARPDSEYTVKRWNLTPATAPTSAHVVCVPLYIVSELTQTEIRAKFNDDNAYALFANALDLITGTDEEKSDKYVKKLAEVSNVMKLYKIYNGKTVDLLAKVREAVVDGTLANYGKFFDVTWANGKLKLHFYALLVDGTLSGTQGISIGKNPSGRGYFVISDGNHDGKIIDPVGVTTQSESEKIAGLPLPTVIPTGIPTVIPTTVPVNSGGGGCAVGELSWAVALLLVPAVLAGRKGK